MHITQLIEQFENCKLPKEKWNHEAHLRVALYYLFNNDFYTALSKVRCGIIRYNASKETDNLCSNKYHETITFFWCIKIQEFIESFVTEPLDKIEIELLKTHMKNSHFIEKYYEKKFLSTAEARAHFTPTKDTKLP